MLQDIAPRRYYNVYQPTPPKERDFVLFYLGDQTLLSKETGAFFTWEQVCARARADELEFTYYFAIDDTAFHRCHTVPEGVLAEGEWVSMAHFRTMQPQWLGFAGITAHQLHGWYQSHQFCGQCGHPARQDAVERAMRCPACGHLVYPTISPAVIVGVTHGDRLLLTKYSRPGTTRNYALIAGFAEIGESIEDTVRREVMEEVGLPVKNVRFYKSQPWSFSSSLLMGFYCDLEGEDESVTLQEDELGEGTWFDREALPQGGTDISLTREMIERFRQGPV